MHDPVHIFSSKSVKKNRLTYMISLVANPGYLSCHNCSFGFDALLADYQHLMYLTMLGVRADFVVDVPLYGLCDVHHHLNDLAKATSFVHVPQCGHVASCIRDLAWISFPQVLIRHLLSSLELIYRHINKGKYLKNNLKNSS